MLADEGTDIDAVDQNADGLETKKAETNDEAKVQRIVYQSLGWHGPNFLVYSIFLQASPLLVATTQLLPAVDPDGKNQPFTAEQLRLLFNQQLQHYIQETEAFKGENLLLKDQLMLERNGRVQAQVRIVFR